MLSTKVQGELKYLQPSHTLSGTKVPVKCSPRQVLVEVMHVLVIFPVGVKEYAVKWAQLQRRQQPGGPVSRLLYS